ncbi:MAG: hypothetical protein IJ816_00355 [Alloprevotella sp.]|nr:hypothetical protein [Alloprevotella sp.]
MYYRTQAYKALVRTYINVGRSFAVSSWVLNLRGLMIEDDVKKRPYLTNM